MHAYSLSQQDIYIIAGSSAATVATILLILSVLLIVILVRRARTKAKKEQSKTQHGAVYENVTLDKSRDQDGNHIPVSANEAYATAAFTHDNVAYNDLDSTHIYEEYSYYI